IPSIIYGIWGLFILAPFLQKYFQPEVIALFHHVPLLSSLFAGPPYGIGVFETVPPVLKEAAYGLGCTTWEVVRRVVIPHTRAGVIGAIMLALGRALG